MLEPGIEPGACGYACACVRRYLSHTRSKVLGGSRHPRYEEGALALLQEGRRELDVDLAVGFGHLKEATQHAQRGEATIKRTDRR